MAKPVFTPSAECSADRLTVKQHDGRELEVFTAGAQHGTALILNHGTPSCGMLYEGWSQACAARGIRLVGYSRPGYGASTRHAGRSLTAPPT